MLSLFFRKFYLVNLLCICSVKSLYFGGTALFIFVRAHGAGGRLCDRTSVSLGYGNMIIQTSACTGLIMMVVSYPYMLPALGWIFCCLFSRVFFSSF